MNKTFLAGLMFVLAFTSSMAQEIMRPLTMSVEKAEQYQIESRYPKRAMSVSRANGITLPFIDDFSRYSLSTNNPEIPLDWQMWVDNSARINSSLPINPPTKGVATLDGLDKTGYPYDFSNEFSYGSADTLTSCPIDLSSYNVEDSVKLVFYYEGGGLGNAPDFEDELFVEFLVPNSTPQLWQQVWSTPGVGSTEFQRAFIHVNDELWLEEDFQFRFRNFSTLSGNVDHWHIDYVWMDHDIVDAEFSIVDVSANGNRTTLLQGYHSIPWEHYQSATAGFMAPNFPVSFRNLGEDRNISFGTEISFEGTLIADFSQQLSTALNGFSTFGQPFSINDNTPNNFSYPTDLGDTCATFLVKHFCNTTPDINTVNDTLEFEQNFVNYYAYDDGSAEGAYALNEPGSSIAMRFNNLLEDSLVGLLIHFSPFTLNNSNETFLLRVWEDSSGEPGLELEENFELHYPGYYAEGYDVFEFYEYDEPVHIPLGNFHVGIVQTNNAELNIGYDKSFNANSANLKFKLGPFGSWTQSGVQGSLMIRPVFQSDKELEWDFVDVDEISTGSVEFKVYPNPSQSVISSDLFVYGRNLVIMNSLGVVVKEEIIVSSQVDISDLSQGVYVSQLLEKGSVVGMTKFIKN
ncbi:MAG: T9SS type A sorting domain-containing protein [Flavobacteriales bacterium]